MIHTEEVDRCGEPVKAGPTRSPRAWKPRWTPRAGSLPAGGGSGTNPGGRLLTLLLILSFVLFGCDDTTTEIPDPAFGHVGQIQIEVRSLLGDAGELDEILIWLSRGPWAVTERVSYNGNGGAEATRAPRLNPGELTQEYASLIRQLNQAQGLRLFGEEIPQELEPECATRDDLADPNRPGDELPDTRVIVTIQDETRGETARWVRCTQGRLLGDAGSTISRSDAAPSGTGAERVITAAQLARAFATNDELGSTFVGTIPFAVIEQGQDSPARPEGPAAFVSSDGTPPAAFVAFWRAHAGPSAPLPDVSWSSEIVLLAAVGERDEAGEVVRIRRVEGLGPINGTRVQVVRRVPGDFCSPAALRSYPYQIVVVPRASDRLFLPFDFTSPTIERVSCGA